MMAAVWLALCLIWSTTWLAIKVQLESVPPLTAAGLRFALAGGVFLVYRVARGRTLWVGRRERRQVHILSATLFVVPFGLVYAAEQVAPSGLGAVLWASLPFSTAFIASWFSDGERATPPMVAGILVGIAGVAVVSHQGLEISGVPPWAVVALLVAPTSAAFAQVTMRRDRGLAEPSLLLGWSMLAAGLVLFAAGRVIGEPPPVAAVNGILALCYLTGIGSVLAFALLHWLLQRMVTPKVGLLYLVTPILALFLGAAVLDEPVSASVVGGSLLVVVGVRIAASGGTE
jgi:drug/metabolite transporter (DMT)-like permease